MWYTNEKKSTIPSFEKQIKSGQSIDHDEIHNEIMRIEMKHKIDHKWSCASTNYHKISSIKIIKKEDICTPMAMDVCLN